MKWVNLYVMDDFYERWADKHGLLHPNMAPSDSENGILFLAYYFYLFKNFSGDGEEWRDYFLVGGLESSLKSNIRLSDGVRRVGPWSVSDKPHYSHDNDTGFRALSVGAGFNYHKQIPFKDLRINIGERLHPRDWGFRLACYGGIFRLLAVPLLWVTSITMILTCAQNYKVRGGNRILKTDGKLLAWLRCQVLWMPVTFWICTKIIKSNNNFTSWKNCFKIYFKEHHHPCNWFPEKVYNVRKVLF